MSSDVIGYLTCGLSDKTKYLAYRLKSLTLLNIKYVKWKNDEKKW